jgi:hypothetical protein
LRAIIEIVPLPIGDGRIKTTFGGLAWFLGQRVLKSVVVI